ncbi:MAG: hypothetical protein K2W80_03245 [Burkholderiales bacterium]|nr:hypothetical protein [Burkholderiales bacterium]
MFDRQQSRQIIGTRVDLRAAGGRLPRVGSLRCPWLLVLALLVLLPVAPLAAQPSERQAGPRERFEERRQRRDDMRPERREEHREERRRHFEERRERMTPEERRSLRRDLDEAGRYLYRRER